MPGSYHVVLRWLNPYITLSTPSHYRLKTDQHTKYIPMVYADTVLATDACENIYL
jgi:hypothetical protein